MNTIIKYNHFLIFTENKEKYFHAEFKDGINIIFGGNTSGKSSILQAINYTFGINDEKHKLIELLNENLIFRIDFEIITNYSRNISIVRCDDQIYVREKGKSILSFNGISADNSTEHIRFKEYLSALFNCTLKLDSNGEKKPASIEAIFLPYYVSQDYGWVITLKSFRGFEYYKRFKETYYDYYLGISNESETEEKYLLEQRLKTLRAKSDFLSQVKLNDKTLDLSIINDEAHIKKATEYVDTFKSNKRELIAEERKQIIRINKKIFLEQRLSTLRVVNSHLINQVNNEPICPLCHKILDLSIENRYNLYQGFEDTKELLAKYKEELKSITSEINSHEKRINKLKAQIEREYAILEQCTINDLSMNSWIRNKVDVELSSSILEQNGEIDFEIKDIQDRLRGYRTEQEVIEERNSKANKFRNYFLSALNTLEVNTFNEPYNLYNMGLFPQQGVELLKTLLSYHLSLNKMIYQTQDVHRLPLSLDAIFKEDVTEENKIKILKYIEGSKPTDTQTIISIAESIDSGLKVEEFNKTIFANTATLIKVGYETRCLLKEMTKEMDTMFQETIDIMTT